MAFNPQIRAINPASKNATESLDMIETIKIGEEVCALIVKHDFKSTGIEFFTKQSDTLQLGYMNRAQGYKIQPHIHKPVKRVIEYTNEVLFIKSGKVKINFYDNERKYHSSSIVTSGDVILLSACGHGFEMLEDSEIIEAKQGPYAGENDKIRFDENSL